MYLTSPSENRYLKTTAVLLSVLVSLCLVSSVNAHTVTHTHKHKHIHKHKHKSSYNEVIHEIYVLNPRPVIAQNGNIVRNHIGFNPQPVINVPTPRCDTPSSSNVVKQSAAYSPVPVPNQAVQLNYYDE